MKKIIIASLISSLTLGGFVLAKSRIYISESIGVDCSGMSYCNGTLEKVYDSNNGVVCYVASYDGSVYALSVSCVK